MGTCHSGDHIAEDHIHTDITSCNIEEPQGRWRTVTDHNSSPRAIGSGELKIGINASKRCWGNNSNNQCSFDLHYTTSSDLSVFYHKSPKIYFCALNFGQIYIQISGRGSFCYPFMACCHWDCYFM